MVEARQAHENTLTSKYRSRVTSLLYKRRMDDKTTPETYAAFTATNGVSFGGVETAVPWGRAGGPLVPRPYRRLHGSVDAPSHFKELAGCGQDTVLGDLDRAFWSRLPLPIIAESQRRSLAEKLATLAAPLQAVAIPGGTPMGWVATLPLRTRSKNAVSRFIQFHGPGPLPHSLLIQDIMEWKAVGIGTLLDLLCVLESAELDSKALQRLNLESLGPPAAHVSSPAEQCLANVAAWAMAETDAVTIGDAVASLVGRRAPVREWRDLAELRLRDLAHRVPHPYRVLESWIEGLPDREALIFRGRQSHPGGRRTLQEVGDQLGLTRERIRQLEKLMMEDLEAFIQTPSGRAIRWRVDSIRRQLGVAAPVDQVQDLLKPPHGVGDYSHLFKQLAGPYRQENDWLLLKSAETEDPTRTILAQTDSFGCVDMAIAHRSLHRWGLADDLHLPWLIRDDRCRIVHGRLLLWRGPVTDKLAFALDAEGSPMTVEQMLDYLGLARSPRSVRNALGADERFVRVNLTNWGLADWGHAEYKGIAASIRSLLDDNGPMPVNEVVKRMRKSFQSVEASTRAYCRAPAFVIERGWIRIRGPDEPYIYPVDSPLDSRGVFVLGTTKVAKLFKIDHDTMRGSGRVLGNTAGKALGIMPNDRLLFESPEGWGLTVTFPDTSITGPLLGSTRAIVEGAQARPGHYLRLVLNRSDMSVSAIVTRMEKHDPGWDLVARLTGIDPEADRVGLAAALLCKPSDVESVLRSRGDDGVIRAIPQ